MFCLLLHVITLYLWPFPSSMLDTDHYVMELLNTHLHKVPSPDSIFVETPRGEVGEKNSEIFGGLLTRGAARLHPQDNKCDRQ